MYARICRLAAACLAGWTTLQAAEVFPWDSSWRFMKGLSEPSEGIGAWREADFDDSAWTEAPAPFWYGDVQPAPGTELADMRYNYTGIYARRSFELANPAAIGELVLTAQSDDGFIAWVNGHPLARFNVPDGEIPSNGTSLPALSEPIAPVTYTLENAAAYLRSGRNVIAVQALNASIDQSSDFVFNATLSANVDATPPVMTILVPDAGDAVRSLRSIEVGFSEAVAGVDAADLRINGQPATNVAAVSPGQFVFEFPQPPTGRVDVAWVAGHGIRDLAATPNAFTGGAWSYTLDPNLPVPGVMISEFMADNDDTLNDENGDSSDWIELYNPTPSPVSLRGWFLTDRTNNLTRWRFPDVSLPARDYLLVFASEKNRTNPLAPLHTNFRLPKDRGYLALVDPNTNVVSDFYPVYPPQQEDVSYGRAVGASQAVGFFLEPTPRKENKDNGPGFAPEVTFSHRGGTFIDAFQLTLGTASTNAVIYYTLNGTMPTNTSTVFTGPITVTNSVLVRARALETGLLPGPIRSEGFVALGPTVINRTSDLPLVILHNFGAGAFTADTDKPSYLLIDEPVNGVSSLTNRADFRQRAGANLRGSSTEGYPKRSFAVELWNEVNADLDRGVLGMPAESDWVLYAPNNFEPVLIHNPYIYELSRRIGRYAPRTRFVELYVNTSTTALSTAHYQGVYVLMEKIKRAPGRVDLDGLEPEHAQAPEVTGGYVLKIDRQDWNERSFWSAGVGPIFVSPKGLDMDLPQRQPQWQYIQSYFDGLDTALNNANPGDPVTGYPAFVDVPSWLDHHILNILAFNVDALRLSGYFFKPRNGKIEMGPIWDFDRSLGSTDGRDANPRLWRSTVADTGTDMFNSDWIFSNPWYSRMFRDIDFWQAWVDRWQELRRGEFALTNLHNLVESQAAQVWKAQPREVGKWPGHAPRGGSYRGEVDLMKRWLSNRVDFIDTNFLRAPVLSLAGGPVTAGSTVTLEGPPGATLYYTLDGSDPRLPGGGFSPKADVYSGPVTINANARLVARSYNANHRNLTGANRPPLSTPWSGPQAATFVVAMPSLALTEIMFHPADPPPGNTNATENFAFLELKNTGVARLNLEGVRFTEGVRYTFTAASGVTSLGPGEYVVIVKNRAAFQSRYPGVTNIAGEYEGSLDDGGERLRLEGPLQEVIGDFSYDDGWQPLADGAGFSLVLSSEQLPAGNWGSAGAWRRSSALNGSPGRLDPPPADLPVVWVNEALVHTDPPQKDSVELYNPGAAPAKIGGWFLTDDFNDPRKFQFPPATEVPARGHLTFDEDDFNVGPQAFTFSSLGDEVHLFSGDGTNLTGYVHGFAFGASANGESFGRHVDSLGREHFVAQARLTLNDTNTGPRLGPLVINEIMFEPPLAGTNNNTLYEFIELRNITADDVHLYDINAPTNAWRLRGGVEFDFPTGILVPSGHSVLLVNFDPDFDFGPLAAFKTNYNVPDDLARILGPYRGNLNNAGERLALYQPDPPQLPGTPDAGFVPYVLVEEVNYVPLPPWPTNAAATGLSLQRILPGAFGDDPANWRVAEPTAGRFNTDPDADWDDDGLPNDWEVEMDLDPRNAFGDAGASGDPDRDGLTNLQEYQAGTHPRQTGSRLEIASVQINDVETLIRFQTVAGKTYSVLMTDDPVNGPWQRLADVDAQADFLVSVRDPARAEARYYRLVTPATP